MTIKIASFESLELLFSKKNRDCFAITFPQSPCLSLTKSNYPSAKIISVDLLNTKKKSLREVWKDENDIITSTNLTQLLHENDVKGIAVDTVSSLELENWAKKEEFQIIATPWEIQEKIENKIFFDQFLKKNKIPSPRSWILRTSADIEEVGECPLILQVPDSKGSAGTFFVSHKKEIPLLMKDKKISFPLLCREYIDNGIPLGVSALISSEKMIFSALRTQAYFLEKDGSSKYYGVQWLKTSTFGPEIIEKINHSLCEISKSFQKIGFHGIASFDIILRDKDLYFIECNPRLGGATPQLSFQEELLHGLTFCEEFVRSCSGEELSAHKPFLPNSNYEGFNLDLDFLNYTYLGKKIDVPAVGFYRLNGAKLNFHSLDKEDFRDAKTVFIYNFLPPRITISPDFFLGFAMTHQPLLDANNKYAFSKKGKEFLKNIENLFLKNDK